MTSAQIEAIELEIAARKRTLKILHRLADTFPTEPVGVGVIKFVFTNDTALRAWPIGNGRWRWVSSTGVSHLGRWDELLNRSDIRTVTRSVLVYSRPEWTVTFDD
jgi:hypothetical protein